MLQYKYSVNYFPCYNHRSIKRRTFINLLISISYWSSSVIIVLTACGFIEFIWDAARIRINMKTILGAINKYFPTNEIKRIWYTRLLNSNHRLWYIGCNTDYIGRDCYDGVRRNMVLLYVTTIVFWFIHPLWSRPFFILLPLRLFFKRLTFAEVWNLRYRYTGFVFLFKWEFSKYKGKFTAVIILSTFINIKKVKQFQFIL